jgi:hypothetical protein
MKFDFNEIKNCINEKGDLCVSSDVLSTSFRAAEVLCEQLLGATLNVRGKKFVIRMLEIYYGSAGDYTHDWFRNNFIKKSSKNLFRTQIQTQKGFKIYLSLANVKSRYTRLDIVVGNEGVAISFLLRSVWGENFDIIGKKEGSPNVVLNAMGIDENDHGKEISVDNLQSEISLEITEAKIYTNKNLEIERKLRRGLPQQFEENNSLLWNFTLVNKQ